MAVDLGGVFIEFKSNVNQFVKELRQVGFQLNVMESLAHSAEQKMRALMVTAQYGARASLAVMLDMAGVAGELDQAMSDLATVLDTTAQGFSDIENAAINWSNSHVTSVKEITKATYDMASAGLEQAQIMETINRAATLSVATFGTMEEATRAMANAMLTFGAALGGTSTEAEKAESIMNTFAYTVQQFRIILPELESGLGKVTGVANTLGASLEDMSIGIGILKTAGLSAEEAGTALKNFYERIGRAAKEFNLELYDSSGNLRSLGDLLGQINAAFDESTTEVDKYTKLLTIFGQRGVKAVSILSTFTDALEEHGSAVKDSSVAYDMAAAREEGFSAHMQILSNNLNNLKAVLADSLVPTIKAFSKFIGDAAIGLQQLPSAFAAIIAQGGLAVTVITMLGSGFWLVGRSVKALITTFSEMVKGVQLVLGVTSGLSGVFMAAVAAIAALVVWTMKLAGENERAKQSAKDLIMSLATESEELRSHNDILEEFVAGNLDSVSAQDDLKAALDGIFDKIPAYVLGIQTLSDAYAGNKEAVAEVAEKTEEYINQFRDYDIDAAELTYVDSQKELDALEKEIQTRKILRDIILEINRLQASGATADEVTDSIRQLMKDVDPKFLPTAFEGLVRSMNMLGGKPLSNTGELSIAIAKVNQELRDLSLPIIEFDVWGKSVNDTDNTLLTLSASIGEAERKADKLREKTLSLRAAFELMAQGADLEIAQSFDDIMGSDLVIGERIKALQELLKEMDSLGIEGIEFTNIYREIQQALSDVTQEADKLTDSMVSLAVAQGTIDLSMNIQTELGEIGGEDREAQLERHQSVLQSFISAAEKEALAQGEVTDEIRAKLELAYQILGTVNSELDAITKQKEAQKELRDIEQDRLKALLSEAEKLGSVVALPDLTGNLGSDFENILSYVGKTSEAISDAEERLRDLRELRASAGSEDIARIDAAISSTEAGLSALVASAGNISSLLESSVDTFVQNLDRKIREIDFSGSFSWFMGTDDVAEAENKIQLLQDKLRELVEVQEMARDGLVPWTDSLSELMESISIDIIDANIEKSTAQIDTLRDSIGVALSGIATDAEKEMLRVRQALSQASTQEQLRKLNDLLNQLSAQDAFEKLAEGVENFSSAVTSAINNFQVTVGYIDLLSATGISGYDALGSEISSVETTIQSLVKAQAELNKVLESVGDIADDELEDVKKEYNEIGDEVDKLSTKLEQLYKQQAVEEALQEFRDLEHSIQVAKESAEKFNRVMGKVSEPAEEVTRLKNELQQLINTQTELDLADPAFKATEAFVKLNNEIRGTAEALREAEQAAKDFAEKKVVDETVTGAGEEKEKASAPFEYIGNDAEEADAKVSVLRNNFQETMGVLTGDYDLGSDSIRRLGDHAKETAAEIALLEIEAANLRKENETSDLMLSLQVDGSAIGDVETKIEAVENYIEDLQDIAGTFAWGNLPNGAAIFQDLQTKIGGAKVELVGLTNELEKLEDQQALEEIKKSYEDVFSQADKKQLDFSGLTKGTEIDAVTTKLNAAKTAYGELLELAAGGDVDAGESLVEMRDNVVMLEEALKRLEQQSDISGIWDNYNAEVQKAINYGNHFSDSTDSIATTIDTLKAKLSAAESAYDALMDAQAGGANVSEESIAKLVNDIKRFSEELAHAEEEQEFFDNLSDDAEKFQAKLAAVTTIPDLAFGGVSDAALVGSLDSTIKVVEDRFVAIQQQLATGEQEFAKFGQKGAQAFQDLEAEAKQLSGVLGQLTSDKILAGLDAAIADANGSFDSMGESVQKIEAKLDAAKKANREFQDVIANTDWSQQSEQAFKAVVAGANLAATAVTYYSEQLANIKYAQAITDMQAFYDAADEMANVFGESGIDVLKKKRDYIKGELSAAIQELAALEAQSSRTEEEEARYKRLKSLVHDLAEEYENLNNAVSRVEEISQKIADLEETKKQMKDFVDWYVEEWKRVKEEVEGVLESLHPAELLGAFEPPDGWKAAIDYYYDYLERAEEAINKIKEQITEWNELLAESSEATFASYQAGDSDIIVGTEIYKQGISKLQQYIKTVQDMIQKAMQYIQMIMTEEVRKIFDRVQAEFDKIDFMSAIVGDDDLSAMKDKLSALESAIEELYDMKQYLLENDDPNIQWLDEYDDQLQNLIAAYGALQQAIENMEAEQAALKAYEDAIADWANSISGVLAGAFDNFTKNLVDLGESTAWEVLHTEIKENVKSAIVNGLIEAVLESALIKDKVMAIGKFIVDSLEDGMITSGELDMVALMTDGLMETVDLAGQMLSDVMKMLGMAVGSTSDGVNDILWTMEQISNPNFTPDFHFLYEESDEQIGEGLNEVSEAIYDFAKPEDKPKIDDIVQGGFDSVIAILQGTGEYSDLINTIKEEMAAEGSLSDSTYQQINQVLTELVNQGNLSGAADLKKALEALTGELSNLDDFGAGSGVDFSDMSTEELLAYVQDLIDQGAGFHEDDKTVAEQSKEYLEQILDSLSTEITVVDPDAAAMLEGLTSVIDAEIVGLKLQLKEAQENAEAASEEFLKAQDAIRDKLEDSANADIDFYNKAINKAQQVADNMQDVSGDLSSFETVVKRGFADANNALERIATSVASRPDTSSSSPEESGEGTDGKPDDPDVEASSRGVVAEEETSVNTGDIADGVRGIRGVLETIVRSDGRIEPESGGTDDAVGKTNEIPIYPYWKIFDAEEELAALAGVITNDLIKNPYWKIFEPNEELAALEENYDTGEDAFTLRGLGQQVTEGLTSGDFESTLRRAFSAGFNDVADKLKTAMANIPGTTMVAPTSQQTSSNIDIVVEQGAIQINGTGINESTLSNKIMKELTDRMAWDKRMAGVRG